MKVCLHCPRQHFGILTLKIVFIVYLKLQLTPVWHFSGNPTILLEQKVRKEQRVKDSRLKFIS